MYSLYSHNSRTTFNSQLSTLNFISYTAYSRKYTYIIYYITYSIYCQQKNRAAIAVRITSLLFFNSFLIEFPEVDSFCFITVMDSEGTALFDIISAP